MSDINTGALNHLLLIGGGHAHVSVLADWIAQGLPCEKATLLTPHKLLRYSGMVPGWIAGQYQRDDGIVDLEGLAMRAGVELVLDRCVALDPESRTVLTSANGVLSFDMASIDTGGVGQARRLLGDDPRLIDIRPIDRFVPRLNDFPPLSRIAVVGGGAGGAEIAFALRNRNQAVERPDLLFVAGADGLVPEHSTAVRANVTAELNRQGIVLLEGNARFKDGKLFVARQSIEPIDLVVAAVGSAAPDWPKGGGLACDDAGFILVDRHQRSISHPHIFAAGDVAAREDRPIPHSGVHAVFAGPVLAENLRAVILGRDACRSYQPRANNLYLISTGNGSAIASYGRFSAKGRWVSRLKHWIDNRWISKYRRMARSK